MRLFFSVLSIIVLIFHKAPHIQASINLESETSDFICDCFKMNIPGHPYAFNSSIVKWNDSLWMSFREIIDPGISDQSRIAIVRLDENFEPVGPIQSMNCQIEAAGLDDARLFAIEDRLFLIYSAICREIPFMSQIDPLKIHSGYGISRMYISELIFEENQFLVINTDYLGEFDCRNPMRSEKNWVPFHYRGHLLLSYSISPHRIFYPILGQNRCETLTLSTNNIEWNLGELRGGTPAILDGDKYISFFHSSTPMKTVHSNDDEIIHYFMGAYTYSCEPPFDITDISPAPIIGKGFYEGEIYTPYWHPTRVVFPYGIVSNDVHIWISYGRQDHEIWIAKLDKKRLLESLIPVKSNRTN